MHRTRIKICGLRDAATARAAAQAGADAVGLVFVGRSVRNVTIEQARDVIAALPSFVEPVALFVDASLERMNEIASQLGIRALQLHGRETPETVAALAPRSVVKAINFDADKPETAWRSWGGLANLSGVLIDAPPAIDEANESLPGGGGVAFDWRKLASGLLQHEASGELALILAGGLTSQNVGEAVEIVRPWAVDVSSGVESSRGVKDVEKIEAFIAAVRQADLRIAQNSR